MPIQEGGQEGGEDFGEEKKITWSQYCMEKAKNEIHNSKYGKQTYFT